MHGMNTCDQVKFIIVIIISESNELVTKIKFLYIYIIPNCTEDLTLDEDIYA